MDALEAIFARRSVGRLTDPAPAGDDLRTILEAGAAAPDHGELRPWRFVLLAGEAKVAFGGVLAHAYLARATAGGVEPHPAKEEKERTKLGRAPLVVVVAAVRRPDETIPWDEQRLAAGAAAQNMLLAATALGYGSMWRTGDPAYDPLVKSALGLRDEDAVIGFLYLGTPHEGRGTEARTAERGRPGLDGLVEEWAPPAR